MRDAKKKTLRFWTNANGIDNYVKLALQEGQSLSHTTGGPNEEGFCYTRTTWTMVDGEVMLEIYTQSRDCDGPSSYYYRATWDGEETFIPEDYDHMSDTYSPMKGVPALPRFKKAEESHRDTYAEMANY